MFGSKKTGMLAGVHVLIAVGAMALISGCESDTRPVNAPPPQMKETPPPQADQLRPQNLDTFRSTLAQSNAQIGSTLAALSDLTRPDQENLQAAYNKYCDQLAMVQQNSESLKRQTDMMRQSRDSYFGAWEEKVEEINNPTIRASAEARRKRLRDAHEQIVTASGEARDAYVPFMKDLQDIRKYLSTDLSRSSVADLKDAAAKVQVDGRAVRGKIDAIIATLDNIQNG